MKVNENSDKDLVMIGLKTAIDLGGKEGDLVNVQLGKKIAVVTVGSINVSVEEKFHHIHIGCGNVFQGKIRKGYPLEVNVAEQAVKDGLSFGNSFRFYLGESKVEMY